MTSSLAARTSAPLSVERAAKLLARFTYFIQAGKDGPIKIGVTDDVVKRLHDLQTGCWVELHLLGIIFGDVEKEMHQRFARGHIRGEWFEPCCEVLSAPFVPMTKGLLVRAVRANRDAESVALARAQIAEERLK